MGGGEEKRFDELRPTLRMGAPVPHTPIVVQEWGGQVQWGGEGTLSLMKDAQFMDGGEGGRGRGRSDFGGRVKSGLVSVTANSLCCPRMLSCSA